MTVDTARRLARALGTSTEFWLNLQMHYELSRDGAANDISDIGPLKVA